MFADWKIVRNLCKCFWYLNFYPSLDYPFDEQKIFQFRSLLVMVSVDIYEKGTIQET